MTDQSLDELKSAFNVLLDIPNQDFRLGRLIGTNSWVS